MATYELYQGEELIGKGTAEELANKFNITVTSLRGYSQENYHDKLKPGSNARIAFRSDRYGPVKKKHGKHKIRNGMCPKCSGRLNMVECNNSYCINCTIQFDKQGYEVPLE